MDITFFHNKQRWSWTRAMPCIIPATIFVQPGEDVGLAIQQYLKEIK